MSEQNLSGTNEEHEITSWKYHNCEKKKYQSNLFQKSGKDKAMNKWNPGGANGGLNKKVNARGTFGT